ncbi:hypothetical protein MMC11_002670 [Xylographa trunciseda]|nr:hypothetical protein [Xylographa trunciseda]
MPRVHGVLLNDVWWDLSDSEKEKICDDLARYQDLIARTITSNVLHGVTGEAYSHPAFIAHDRSIGEWYLDTREVPGRLTADQLRQHMSNISDGAPILEFGPTFHFFHGDLSSRNVILSVGEKSDDGGEREAEVAGIIDWERARFVPAWYITLYPCGRNGAYWVTIPPSVEPVTDEDMCNSPGTGTMCSSQTR